MKNRNGLFLESIFTEILTHHLFLYQADLNLTYLVNVITTIMMVIIMMVIMMIVMMMVMMNDDGMMMIMMMIVMI